VELHFRFTDEGGRRYCELVEAGVRKSVRAKVGPPVLVARLFNLIGALSPRDFARLQAAASRTGSEEIAARVVDPSRLPAELRRRLEQAPQE
jgi:hypothetical protein